MNTEPHRAASANDQLEQVLAAYLRAVEAGPSPSRAEWLERYPALAEELKLFFDNQQAVEQLVKQSGASSTPRWFGDYELLRELGRGGMGVVYQARQASVGRFVALKMILAGKLASASDVVRFRLETEAAAQLDHPHIVPLYEVGERDEQQYFTMKLIEGGSLAEHRGQFRDNPAAAALLVEKVAGAVHAAHQHGILHRDLKPANILLDHEGQPLVTDFGLAKRLGNAEQLTESGAVVGTASYMAPEQTRGQTKDLTTAVDIHSLGVILYELLTGALPFRGATTQETLRLVQQHEPTPVRARNRRVDRDLEAICLKCLEKEPRRRYVTAHDLAEDLRRWRCREPVLARPVGTVGRLRRWCRKYPERAGLLLTLAILFAAALVTALSAARSRAARLEEETLKANVYAARGVASTVLWQLERLSQPVLETAADPALVDLLTEYDRAADSPLEAAALEKLQDHIRTVYRKNSDANSGIRGNGEHSPFQSWHVLSRNGRLIADSVERPRVIGDSFVNRDYFQGARERAGKPGRAAVHISCVYQSRNDDLHKFAIAVAVRGRGDSGFAGVVAATLTTTATLGSLRLDDDRRKAILVGRLEPDLGPGNKEPPTNDVFLVLLHPSYSRGDRAIPLPTDRFRLFRGSQGLDEFTLPDSTESLDPALNMDRHYEDPVGAYDERYRGRWLAGCAPVGNTEFMVIVQQRYDESIGPEHTSVLSMAIGGLVALFLAALAIGACLRWWIFRDGS